MVESQSVVYIARFDVLDIDILVIDVENLDVEDEVEDEDLGARRGRGPGRRGPRCRE